MNDINFPAGVLEPPLYDPKMDDAPNYGNTGATIGHELTHGFDDEGRQFDAKGNLKDWWTKQDAAAFVERAGVRFHPVFAVHRNDVAADIDKEPVARGLEAIAVGFSLRFPDDEEVVARSMFTIHCMPGAACK